MNVIEARELVKYFNNIKAVDGVTFSVKEGEIFGFLGPNGAGKTTTINILCTLLRATSGYAELAGYDVIKYPNEVRRSIGLVFQETTLDEKLTARDNLLFHAYIYDVPGKEIRQRIEQVLGLVGLRERADETVRTYSGGMKRRLEIARGLLHYPKVLFLDEPTIGLDPQTRNSIWEHVLELKKRENITIFLTTHYMEEAEVCDHIAIIDHGKIIAFDTPKQLKRSIGGDVITFTSDDNEKAAKLLKQNYGIEAGKFEENLRFEVAEGNRFIPVIVRELGVNIQSIEVHEPTLDDVFLNLTGRAIREEEGSVLDDMRRRNRMWRRGHH